MPLPALQSAAPAPYLDGTIGRACGGGSLHPGGPALTVRLLELSALQPGETLLDLGCGTAQSLSCVPQGVAVFGLDYAYPLLLEGAEQHPGARLMQGRGVFLPLADESVDVVLAECSLSLAGSLQQTLAEVCRVLRPGGRLAISDVSVSSEEGAACLRSLPLGCGLSNPHLLPPERGFSELEDVLARAGFQVLIREDHPEAIKEFIRGTREAFGSPVSFWQSAEPLTDPMDLVIALHRAKPGYFVLIAKKIID